MLQRNVGKQKKEVMKEKWVKKYIYFCECHKVRLKKDCIVSENIGFYDYIEDYSDAPTSKISGV